MATSTKTPRWVEQLLARRGTWLIARVLLISTFLAGGVEKLLNFPGATQEMQRFGLHPAWVWAGLAVMVELGGSMLIILGRQVWFAAGGLGVLTAVAALTANHFWTLTGKAEVAAANGFLDDLGLIGGLLLAAAMSSSRTRKIAWLSRLEEGHADS
jgi:uncharacterized membrane protein YphA (DoxX/SURF4 family)